MSGVLISPETIQRVARRYASYQRFDQQLSEILDERPSVIFLLKQEYLEDRRGKKY